MHTVVPTLTREARMLVEADIWLIERVFERFSHWWQKTVSYKQDCFWWARTIYVFLILYLFISTLTQLMFFRFEEKREESIVLLFVTIFMCLFAPIVFY
ncbi:MAG: hypothetical protein Q8R36_02200, partial [bacterium]|nr:hypothetical protein [bacterium]